MSIIPVRGVSSLNSADELNIDEMALSDYFKLDGKACGGPVNLFEFGYKDPRLPCLSAQFGCVFVP